MVDRAAEGKTVLLSSHQITEVERVADQVAILHEGKIALVASLDELKSDIHQLTVTLEDDRSSPPNVPGEILRQQHRARQWQLLVRGAPDAGSFLRQQSGVAGCRCLACRRSKISLSPTWRQPEQPVALARGGCKAMTRTVLGRLVWKEYRLLRGFWGGMLLLCLVGQLVALAVAEPMRTSQPIDPAQYLYLVAVALTAFYVLGCGATAFAGERDAGTYLLQRVLPVTPGRLLLGKLLYTGLSALLLGVAAWVLAAVLVSLRGWHPQDSHSAIALLGGVKAIELLAWGVFFSLLTSRPLRAVVLAALTTSVVSYPLSWMLSDIPEQSRGVFYFPSFLGDVSTILPRLIIAALVLAYDVRLVGVGFANRIPSVTRNLMRPRAFPARFDCCGG